MAGFKGECTANKAREDYSLRSSRGGQLGMKVPEGQDSLPIVYLERKMKARVSTRDD